MCSKLVQNHTRNKMNKAPAVDTSRCRHVATSKHRDAMRVQNPTATFTSRRRDVGKSLSHIAMSERHDVTTLRRWECLTQTSCQVTSRHIMSCHVTSQHLNIATFWVLMINVAMLDTNVVMLLGFPATGKLQKSNLWDFYSLPSCSFFVLTILYHLMTIYIKNNTRSKPFHTKNLIFGTFENIGTKTRKLLTMNRF